MINGRGWICIALVVFGSWRPGKALLGAILFGAFDAYQLRLQQLAGDFVPLSGFSDAAVRDVHHRARHHVAPRGIPAGADDTLPEGRTVGRTMRRQIPAPNPVLNPPPQAFWRAQCKALAGVPHQTTTKSVNVTARLAANVANCVAPPAAFPLLS